MPRLRGWFETLAGSYWPLRGVDGRVRSAADSGHVNRRVVFIPDTDLLATNPTCGRGIQVHRPNKTPSDTDGSGLNTGSVPGNTKPNKPEREELNSVGFFLFNFQTIKVYPSHLDHAVAISIGDVRLQASKQGSVVMFEIEVLQPKFRVFNCDLIEYKFCYFELDGN